MYVVTFYSFKGGVGRSMALVNVGVQLAQAGKKVLLVDFDLEAPGLPTFNLAKPETECAGVVDFVIQYMATGESPDVSSFIYQSEQFPSGGGLWVMPVGKQDAQYSQRLNSIDWQELYAQRSGYLLFEDLKRQWETSVAPDYVLIDSRTGHSDVEGICTRQLPNAVSLLFFPNEQNLVGLRRIVANIQGENKRRAANADAIKLHFAVSNVPDLDDEDLILVNTLARFRRELGYRALSAEIHHYNSLSLLAQEIFSLRRPNSRLTKEYAQLKESIARHNFQDRDAVLRFLKAAHSDFAEAMSEGGPTILQRRLEDITKYFATDGEVGLHVALLYEQLGRVEDALNLLSGGAENTYATAEIYSARARLNHRLARNSDAVADVRRLLQCHSINLEAVLKVAPIIDNLEPKLYTDLAISPAFQSLSLNDRFFFVLQSEGNRHQLRANVAILKQILSDGKAPDTDSEFHLTHHALALNCIGIGDFGTAIDLLSPKSGNFVDLDISTSFNLAMAMWGRDGEPPRDLFERVVELDVGASSRANDSANYDQCLAISNAVLGNRDAALRFIGAARQKIDSKQQRTFSGWTYCKVSAQEFLAQLVQIQSLASGEQASPPILCGAD